MLNRDQIRKLVESELIQERTVNWDKSLMGRTTNGVLGLFSMMKGKIKASFNQAKMKSLVQNWGVEYLRALQSVEKNLPAPDASDGANPLEVDREEVAHIVDSKLVDKAELNAEKAKIAKTKKALETLLKAVQSTKSWGSVNNDQGWSKMIESTKNELIKLDGDDLSVFSAFLIDPKEQASADVLIESVLKVVDAFKKEGASVQQFKQSIGMKEPNGSNKSFFTEAIEKLVESLQKLISMHDDASVFIQNWLMVADSMADLEKTPNDLEKIKVRDQNLIKYFTGQSVKHLDQYGNLIEDYMSKVGAKLNERLILEAKGVKIEKWIEEIVDGVDLEAFANEPDIKKRTLEKIDFKMLDIIKYQANFILDKISNSSGPEKSQLPEVKKTWELGLKQLNQLFQDVIDTDKVMQNVKPDVASSEVKAQLKEADSAIDKLKKFNIDEALPASGGKFISNRLYLFNINIQTYKGAKITNKFIALSPLAELIEETDGQTFYWHKVFGQYDVINGTIQRQNLFEGITASTSLINNFDGQENSYFMAFERQAASKSYSPVYVYSNKGSIFWGTKIFKELSTGAKSTISKAKDQQFKLGPVFNFKINARYSIENDKIQNFPGVDQLDLKSEKFVDQAKKNHSELLTLLK